MKTFDQPLVLKEFIIKDLAASYEGKRLSVLGLAVMNSTKFYFMKEMHAFLEEWRNQRKEIQLTSLPKIFPFWIECETAIPSAFGEVTGLLFFSPYSAYKNWSRSWYHSVGNSYSYQTADPSQWELMIFDKQGEILAEFLYVKGNWIFASLDRCPTHECKVTFERISKRNFKHEMHPCLTCQNSLKYWSKWFVVSLALILKEKTLNRESFSFSQPVKVVLEGIRNSITVLAPPARPTTNAQIPIETQQPVKNQPLFIKEYLKKQLEITLQIQTPLTLRQRATKIEVAINHSNKYLWMQSAFLMTEALCDTTDDVPLRIPSGDIYIEMEHPHLLYGQQVAAISFLHIQERQWMLSIVNNIGQTIWHAFYEDDYWTLSQNYVCSEQKCTTEEIQGINLYHLCKKCQEQITYYTSWIAIALRMIEGDFRTHVQIQQSEYMTGTIDRREYDQKSKKAKKQKVNYSYRIIRYLDVSVHKKMRPQTRHGSWMTGRPLTENEYEINPDAIIYVKIYPKEHDRTYHHDRYIHMQGKTQHIDAHPRLQPMTVATFRQLKRVQKITRVFASKFDIQQESN